MSTEATTVSTPALTPEHLKILNDRAIPADFAIKAGLRSVDLAEFAHFKEKYHKAEYPHLPTPTVTGILIPYQQCLDKVPRCRVRSDKTEYTKPGPVEGSHHGEETVAVPRYICQAGIPVVPYIPQEVFDVAGDTSVPIHIVEAPLKALSLTAHGLPAIGLGGVLAGAHDKKALDGLGEIVASEELRRIRWRGRSAIIIYDAGLWNADDHPSNPMVALGAAYVARALLDLGATVTVARLPYAHSQESDPLAGKFCWAEDQGPDDYLARNGVDALKKIIAEAMPADPAERMRLAIQVDGTDARAEAAGRLLGDPMVQAMLHVGGEIATAAVAAVARKTGVTKTAIKDAATTFRERLSRRERQGEPDWMKQMVCTEAGTPRPVRENIELALRYDAGLVGLLAFDEFSQAVVFTRTPPWTERYSSAKAVKAGDPWTDEDDIRLAGYLSERARLLDLNEKKVRAAVTVVARDRTIHPVREYLSKLTWDGTPRMTSWLSAYFGVEDSPYVQNVGKWWLISAVARVMKPGCKVDHTLVFEGAQGIAKSSALHVLGGEWFSDGDLGDLRSKEAPLALQGVWLIELAEGEIFNRASHRALKAFTTKRFDDIVPKYSNLRRRLQRQCAFALTTNDDADYLNDSTGNRRFWPIFCTRVDLDGLKAVRDQLWAEALSEYNTKAVWWPRTNEEKALCEAEQAARRVHDPWEAVIKEKVKTQAKVSITYVLTDILALPVDKQGRREQLRAADCLRGLGWVQPKEERRSDARYWVRGPEAEPMETAAAVPVGAGMAVDGDDLDDGTRLMYLV